MLFIFIIILYFTTLERSDDYKSIFEHKKSPDTWDRLGTCENDLIRVYQENQKLSSSTNRKRENICQ